MNHFVIFADGCCEPRNPNGVATYAIVVVDAITGEVLDEKADIIAVGNGATNNRAELMAVGAALKWALEHEATKVTIKTDSQLAVNLLTGLWQPTPTKPYYPAFRGAMRLLNEAEKRGVEVRLEWVPRQQNERADFLAKQLAVSVFNSLPRERQVALVAGT
jgi:ribonuclease HI